MELNQVDEVFSVKEISLLLKMSTAKIRRLIKSGKLKATNVSTGTIRPNWKVTRSQLDEFLGVVDGAN